MIANDVGKRELVDWLENYAKPLLVHHQSWYSHDEEIFQAIRAAIENGDEGSERERPTIVCLCGSTRFMNAFFDAGWIETLAGKIVLSVGVCKHAEHHGGETLGPEVVCLLDELHLRKIDLADEVLILNVGGYIGESTRNELNYAREKGKRIRFLEPE